MKQVLFLIAIALLLATGAIGDRMLNSTITVPAASAAASPVIASSSSSAASLLPASNMTTSSIDATTERAYAIASASVVYVESVGLGSGSGVIYDTSGNIVTNYHVVNGASQLRVTFNNGRTVSAQLVGVDKVDDLAVIHIHAANLTPAHFATAGSYRVAQMVLSIGSPLGLKQSVASGLISGLGRVEQEPGGAYLPNAIQTSAPINPGNSGGALVTLNGVVVGIPTLVQTSSSNGTATQNIGFAIPSERVVSVANQIIATGKVQHTGRAYLGLAPTDSSSQSASPFDNGSFDPNQSTPSVTGALVSQLSANGPAAQAGVQQGDVITGVNGATVSSADDLLTILAHHQPGDTIVLQLNRNGATSSLQVRLGELPAA